jgi:hypothetical protein
MSGHCDCCGNHLRRDQTIYAKHLPGNRLLVCCCEECLRARVREERAARAELARLLAADDRPADPRPPSLWARLLARLGVAA